MSAGRCSGCDWTPPRDLIPEPGAHSREECPHAENGRWVGAFWCPECGLGYLEYRRNERECDAAATDMAIVCTTEGCYSRTPARLSKCDHCRAFKAARIDRVRANREVSKIAAEAASKLREYTKPCTGCGKSRNRPYGSQKNYCPTCADLRSKYGVRAQTYGMSVQQVAELVETGKCHICGSSGEGEFHVDHDHSTGAVRGLLCKRCNFGIGWFRDSPELLARAIHYLTRGADYRAVDQD